MKQLGMFSAVLACVGLVGCGGENTPSNVTSPGASERAKTRVLESGANVMQDRTPLAALNAYLDGFHFYNGNMQGQMEAHHYCGHLNEDVIQCVIFDGNDEDAKLMGVLMMGFTADGQLNERLLAGRDERFDVSSAELRQKRSDIPYPQVDAQADAWTKGVVMQLQMTKQ